MEHCQDLGLVFRLDVGIPDLSPDVAVWGLNCPFMRVSDKYDIGITGVATRLITEITRISAEEYRSPA